VTTATPQFNAHIGRVLAPGSYCLEIVDVGNLTQTVGLTARVVHPTGVSRPNPRTVTSSSIVTPQGAATLSFATETQGTVTATLSLLDPDVEAGLGFGFVDPQGVDCLISRTMTVTAGATPQYSLPVEPDRYCVSVFDIGNFQQETRYRLQATHP